MESSPSPMDNPDIPPEQTSSVKVFDPLVLDRSLIAIPLLKKMEEELALIKRVNETLPKFQERYNAAIEFNRGYQGAPRVRPERSRGRETSPAPGRYPAGLQGALEHTRDLARESVKNARAALWRKLDRLREDDHDEREIKEEKKRQTRWKKE